MLRTDRLALLLIVAALAAGCARRGERTRPSGPTVADAVAFAAAQPRHLRPVPASPVPAGLTDVRAATCGACHQEIYAEWAVSTHRRAWLDDAQFMEELTKSEAQGVAWMCMNCHTPYADQLPRLVAGTTDGDLSRPIFVDNPSFDPVLQADAIGCATCHVADGAVLGPFGDTAAPHATRKSEALLEVGVCTQCHQATAQFPDLNLACMFDTGEELARGPYDDEGQTCQSCHMPEVERPLVAGFPPRPTRRHWFGGSLIPKAPAFAAELEPLRAHYPEGLAVSWETPASLAPGARASVTIRYANAAAGHLLPTGDPERFLRIEALALGPDGAELGRADVKIGAEHRWWPTVQKVSDNRLAPREERTLSLEFTAPSTGAVTLSLAASKWRLSEETMEYHHLDGRAVPGRSIHEETVVVPVR